MKTYNVVRQLVMLMLIVFVLVVEISPTFAAPSITIDPLCPYGTPNCSVSGTVYGVNYPNYKVAPYIKVDEVWWTKPSYGNPTCPINSTGKYTCHVTTGGSDLYFTAVKVFLIPTGSTPSLCNPCQAPPTNSSSVANNSRDRPYPRTLAFSGYQWRVKKAIFPHKLGPGPNYFSDATNDVWVDNKGLHLRTRQISGNWYSTEVILQQSFGYGTYIFHTNSRIDTIDANAVLGLFTWDSVVYHPTHREMDIEFSKWGNTADSKNSQFIVQNPDLICGLTNCSRFLTNVPTSNNHMTFYMVWSSGKVEFRAYKGQYWGTPPVSSLIRKWTYTGVDTPVPVPGKENIRFNFWLLDGLSPITGNGNEVIIENFIFHPPCSPVLK